MLPTHAVRLLCVIGTRRERNLWQLVKRGNRYPPLAVWYRPKSFPAIGKTGPGKAVESSDGIWWRTNGPFHGISEKNNYHLRTGPWIAGRWRRKSRGLNVLITDKLQTRLQTSVYICYNFHSKDPKMHRIFQHIVRRIVPKEQCISSMMTNGDLMNTANINPVFQKLLQVMKPGISCGLPKANDSCQWRMEIAFVAQTHEHPTMNSWKRRSCLFPQGIVRHGLVLRVLRWTRGSTKRFIPFEQ
jgi:hypothetical protein